MYICMSGIIIDVVIIARRVNQQINRVYFLVSIKLTIVSL